MSSTSLKGRPRIVSFRVDASEYEELTKVCVASGAQSVSELARSSVYDLLHRTKVDGDAGIIMCLRTLDQTIKDLRSEIKQIVSSRRAKR